MIKAIYSSDHPKKEFLQLSKVLKGTIKGNRWSYDNNIGKGYIEFHELDDGLFLSTYETFARKRVAIERKPSLSNSSFVLNFEVSKAASNILVHGSEPINELSGNKFTGIFFASSKTGANFKQPHNIPTKGIRIKMTNEWIQNHFGSENKSGGNFIDSMLKMDRPVYLFEFMDAHSARIINEIFITKTQKIFTKVKLLQLTLDLLQAFFLRIVNRDPNLSREFHFKDLLAIYEAQQYLISDFYKPCPKLSEISSKANMSNSKFARMFKQVFGKSVHRYYQSARMTKARELLETGKYSVQEVGANVGYQHQGKFAAAFKMQFKCTPKQTLKLNPLIAGA